MFDKIIKKIYNRIHKNSQPEKINFPQKWVVCSACNFKGSLNDFLTKESNDTRCPKCGEDIQRFDL